LCIILFHGGLAISSIIIDGYNLIGIFHRDLEKRRDMLIESLIEYHKKRGHEITVVFDGWKTGGSQESRSVVAGIKIIYSRLGDKADAVMKRIIFSEKREWIVVTSDRDIASHAWASGSVPISSEDFLNALERHEVVKGIVSEDEEEEYFKPTRKGNPKKPSKKEKAIKRVLSKL